MTVIPNIDQIEILKEIKSQIEKYNNVEFFDDYNGQIILGENSDYNYKFFLDFSRDQFSIYAILKNNQESDFWYMPFEFMSYQNDVTKASQHFMKTLGILVQYPTKIIQKKGVFFYSFNLMYCYENAWKKVYKNSYFKYANFSIPNASKKEFIYCGK